MVSWHCNIFVFSFLTDNIYTLLGHSFIAKASVQLVSCASFLGVSCSYLTDYYIVDRVHLSNEKNLSVTLFKVS